MLTVRLATAEEAPLVHALMQGAFAEYEGTLPVPSSAHGETVDDVRAAMKSGGAVLAFWDGEAVGSSRFRLDPEAVHVGRVAVSPEHRRRGIASAMMDFIQAQARALGRDTVRIIARESLPSNVELYRKLGFEVVAVLPHPRGADREVRMQKRIDRAMR